MRKAVLAGILTLTLTPATSANAVVFSAPGDSDYNSSVASQSKNYGLWVERAPVKTPRGIVNLRPGEDCPDYIGVPSGKGCFDKTTRTIYFHFQSNWRETRYEFFRQLGTALSYRPSIERGFARITSEWDGEVFKNAYADCATRKPYRNRRICRFLRK